MNTVNKYVLNMMTNVALVVFVCAVLFGWSDFTDALGGVKSFTGLLALLVMGSIVVGGIVFYQRQDYTDRLTAQITHLVIGLGVTATLTSVGYSWVDLPNGAGMKVLVALAACAVAAVITTWLGYVDDE